MYFAPIGAKKLFLGLANYKHVTPTGVNTYGYVPLSRCKSN